MFHRNWPSWMCPSPWRAMLAMLAMTSLETLGLLELCTMCTEWKIYKTVCLSKMGRMEKLKWRKHMIMGGHTWTGHDKSKDTPCVRQWVSVPHKFAKRVQFSRSHRCQQELNSDVLKDCTLKLTQLNMLNLSINKIEFLSKHFLFNLASQTPRVGSMKSWGALGVRLSPK